MAQTTNNFHEESVSYKALFNHATMGIVIVNAEGNILLANPFALKLFDYSNEELIDKSIDVLIPQRFHARHAQHHVNYYSNPQNRPMGTGMELFALKKDGTEFPVEISLGAYEYLNGEKNVIAFVTDITERKKAQTEILKMNDELEILVKTRTNDLIKSLDDLEESKINLQNSLTFQKALLDNVAAMIVTVDKKGIIQTFNPEAEKELGYKAEELIGKHNPLIYHDPELQAARSEELSEELQEKIKPSLKLFQVKTLFELKNQNECMYIRKDGTKFPVKLSVTAMKDAHNKIIGYVGVAFNISQTKEIEQELKNSLGKEKELSELKSRFVSMASHEFRTPLSTVLSSIYLLKKYNSPEDQVKRDKHYERIISSVNLLTDTLNDFLSVGKIEEGKIQVRMTSFNLKELILKVSNDVINALQKKQEIRYLHKGNTEVYLDESLVKHIIMNLISNASKFSPESNPIEITTDCKKNNIRLSVKDYGIGISKEDQKHLKERFFRGSNASNIEGTGLGLHIISKYAELMNGQLECTSELEKGSEFTILFNTLKNDHEKNPSD